MSKRFEGEFFTPNRKKFHPPVPLAGKGFCEVSEEGLRVSAFWKKSRKPQVLTLVSIGMLFGVFLSIQFNVETKIIVAALVGLLLPLSIFILGSKVGDAANLVIPWQYIMKTERMSEANSTYQTVFVTVMGFKLEGEICFLPVSGGKELIQEMDAARKSFLIRRGLPTSNLNNRTIIIER